MFDPRDLADDPRTRTPAKPVPALDRGRERADRRRSGYRAEYDPREGRADIKTRMDRAVAEIGIYRSVAYKDMSEAHFDSHPYATRRAVDRMIQRGDVEEHTAKGPQGGTYKVLTLSRQGARRAEGVAREPGPRQGAEGVERLCQAGRAGTRYGRLPGGPDRAGEAD